METSYIEDFLEFAKTMSYARAARSLFCSTTTVANHVERLEEQIGVALVEKQGQSLSLTPAGSALVRSAPRALEAFVDLLAECRLASERVVEVRVAGQPFPAVTALFRTADHLLQQTNGMELRPSFVSVLDDPHDLLDHEEGADAVVVCHVTERGHTTRMAPTRGFAVPLDAEDVLFSVTDRSPLFNKEEIRARDLKRSVLTCIRDGLALQCASQIRTILATRNIQLDIDYVTTDNVLSYLASCRPSGVCFWIRSQIEGFGLATQRNLRFFELADLPLRCEMRLVLKQEGPVLDALREASKTDPIPQGVYQGE